MKPMKLYDLVALYRSVKLKKNDALIETLKYNILEFDDEFDFSQIDYYLLQGRNNDVKTLLGDISDKIQYVGFR